MNARLLVSGPCLPGLCLMLNGCVTSKPYDYTNFRAHPPRSILVLPPLNESTAVEGTYGYLSTVTFPLAEMGYYVYPVSVTDYFLKENGLPTAGEMHQIRLDKVKEIIGADAVLYLTLKKYGSTYEVVACVTTVAVEGKLVDTRTGLLLWEGTGLAEELSGNYFTAPIFQAVNSSLDEAHKISRMANFNLFLMNDPRFPDHRLPYGPYYPKTESR